MTFGLLLCGVFGPLFVGGKKSDDKSQHTSPILAEKSSDVFDVNAGRLL